MNQVSTLSGRESEKNSKTDKKLLLTKISASMVNRVRIIPTTPYSIFIHSSPVYSTSIFPKRRVGRPARNPQGRYQRRLPFRPDPYPYADQRWSKLLAESKLKTD